MYCEWKQISDQSLAWGPPTIILVSGFAYLHISTVLMTEPKLIVAAVIPIISI